MITVFLCCNYLFIHRKLKAVTCATKGVMRAPTLAIPLLVPRPKALVAVGYTCRVSQNTDVGSLFSSIVVLITADNNLRSSWISYLWCVHICSLKSSCDESPGDEYQHRHGCSATEKPVTLDKLFTVYFAFNIYTSIHPSIHPSTLPPNTTIEWNDAHREDEETQRHRLPPSQSIDGPQCHQQPCLTMQNLTC